MAKIDAFDPLPAWDLYEWDPARGEATFSVEAEDGTPVAVAHCMQPAKPLHPGWREPTEARNRDHMLHDPPREIHTDRFGHTMPTPYMIGGATPLPGGPPMPRVLYYPLNVAAPIEDE